METSWLERRLVAPAHQNGEVFLVELCFGYWRHFILTPCIKLGVGRRLKAYGIGVMVGSLVSECIDGVWKRVQVRRGVESDRPISTEMAPARNPRNVDGRTKADLN